MTRTLNDYWLPLQEELASEGDFEAQLNVLRRFTRDRQADIRNRDLAGNLSLQNLFLELSLLAEAVLKGSEHVAREELGRRDEVGHGAFGIVAMGKFGGEELTYHSDLDVIFFYEDPRDQEFAARLATRIITALSLLTQDGYAYRIDAALRPSGNSGALVSSLDSFRDYHRNVGRTWERQALIKARPVIGAPPFLEKLQAAVVEIVYRDYDAKAVAGEIDRLRGRMEKELAKERPGRYNLKTGRGGIVDIEFATQYLQLIHGAKHPNLRTTNTISALSSLALEEILPSSLAQALTKDYLFYRELETRLRLLLDQPTDELWESTEIGARLSKEFFGGRSLFDELRRARDETRAIYAEIFKNGRSGD